MAGGMAGGDPGMAGGMATGDPGMADSMGGTGGGGPAMTGGMGAMTGGMGASGVTRSLQAMAAMTTSGAAMTAAAAAGSESSAKDLFCATISAKFEKADNMCNEQDGGSEQFFKPEARIGPNVYDEMKVIGMTCAEADARILQYVGKSSWAEVDCSELWLIRDPERHREDDLPRMHHVALYTAMLSESCCGGIARDRCAKLEKTKRKTENMCRDPKEFKTDFRFAPAGVKAGVTMSCWELDSYQLHVARLGHAQQVVSAGVSVADLGGSYDPTLGYGDESLSLCTAGFAEAGTGVSMGFSLGDHFGLYGKECCGAYAKDRCSYENGAELIKRMGGICVLAEARNHFQPGTMFAML